MKITVIGTGYLGAVHAACMADLGHDVVGIDIDASRVEALAAGVPPFHEPGFNELLERALASGRLRFTHETSDTAGADVYFVCVGTPQVAGSDQADLTHLYDSIGSLVEHLNGDSATKPVVVGKSTVPVGTAKRLAERIRLAGGVLVWNPEFLREGYGVQDTLSPDRMIYGLPDDGDAQYAKDVLDQVYADQLRRRIPRLITDYATAELVKVAANSFLATKISFINAMAEICEVAGADVTQLAKAIGMDNRIGKRFLQAGVGFGGGCLPKDLRGFTARAEELGAGESVAFLREVDKINLRRRSRVVTLAQNALGNRLQGARVTVLGASFKPHTDDLRDSPAVEVANRLHELGASVVVTDPVALAPLAVSEPHLAQEQDIEKALADTDLVVLLTEWREFVVLDPERIGSLVREKVMIDGRNVLDPTRWRDAGWDYYSLGRP